MTTRCFDRSLPPETLTLSEPDPQASARSRSLTNKSRQAIDAAGGSIGFDRYMAMALYDPALGYYQCCLEQVRGRRRLYHGARTLAAVRVASRPSLRAGAQHIRKQ
jgi:hypothetical protein